MEYLKRRTIANTVVRIEGIMVKKGIKLKDLHEGIGAASNVRKATVAMVLTEAFRQIQQALERGERVVVSDFGTFLVRENEGGGAQTIRFRPGDWAGPKQKTGGKHRKVEDESA